jgi:hypothetical protein
VRNRNHDVDLKEGVPYYMETQNEKNVAMYEHFELKEIEKFSLLGTIFSNFYP